MFDSLNNLGCTGKNKKTVVVAMSGGVDSSVVAAYLSSIGHSVIGITLRIYDENTQIEKSSHKSCCAGRDINDAKRIAHDFGFPHHVVDYRDTFKQEVIDEFIAGYSRGETPIPCINCNQTIKFRDLFKIAKDIGADALATGHYVRRKVEIDGEVNLYRALDNQKDQSYFMFTIKKDQLDFLRFPLGSSTKTETRELAKKIGLCLANKPDSQDICFVRGGSYKDFIKDNEPNLKSDGYFINANGKVLGKHEGIVNYTIGQRKGIKINSNTALYVLAIDSKHNNILVGSKDDLLKKEVHLKELNWLGSNYHENKTLDVLVKLRSQNEPIEATLELRNNRPLVHLKRPQISITPGQACVIYQGNKLLGGGWIILPDSRD